MTVTPRCNLCQHEVFKTFRGRPAEKCSQCGSLARHRIGWEVYSQHLLGTAATEGRVLHLAPEPWLYPLLEERLDGGYLTADMVPQTYPHAPCLKLEFPKDFDIFPDGYFSAILHNHVMEHIPGHYKDHLKAFVRLMAPGGKMIFSIPGPYRGTQTKEGGEHLGSDTERLEQFLQEDHVRLFGDDLTETLKAIDDTTLIADGISDAFRKSVSVRPGKAPFFILQRNS